MAPESTVLVVDDHALFAEAVTLALSTNDRSVHRVRLDSASSSPSRLLASALRIQPDIALLDLDLGKHGDGHELIQPLTRRRTG